jgi:hypothetical protein
MQAPKEIQAAVAKLIEREGVNDAATQLGMSAEAVLRLAHGHPVRGVTVESARSHLEKLGVL